MEYESDSTWCAWAANDNTTLSAHSKRYGCHWKTGVKNKYEMTLANEVLTHFSQLSHVNCEMNVDLNLLSIYQHSVVVNFYDVTALKS